MSGEIFKTKNTVDESPFDNNTWRWVRERGPLLIEEGKDGRRPGNKWGLFMQYAKSSEVAMHEDDLGRREMVMVDPLIRSRRGCFDGESCQSEFRAAFLLHQNLKAAERWRLGRSDGISPSDLQAIYPGKTIRELERMLGAMLGEIRYGKFLPSRQRRVLADEMRQGESIVGGGAGVAAAIEVRAQKEAKTKRRGKTWVKVVSASGIVLVLASACTRVLPTTPMATDAVRPTEQTNLPTTGTEDTIEPNPTPAIQITPTYSVEAAGGQYTETQLALNNSESAIKQKAVIERWLEYWGNFNNRPFDPETVELKWKYIYDDPNNPTNVFLMLEAGGEYNGRLFMGPIGADGKFAEFPPEVSGTDIGVGYGPLELTAGADGQILSVDSDGIPVRRDGNGNIVEKLNMKTKQWEVIDIKTERERVIVNQINNFLSSSGGYSDDELAEKIFVMGIVKYGEGQSDYKDDLGLMKVSENVASVQGINLGSVEGDNCVWMFFGTKMGEEGKRVVLPVRIPLESIEYRVPILITFYNQRDIAPAGQSTVRLLDDQQIDLRTAPEIVDNLNDDLLGKPMLLSMWYNYPGDLSNDLSGVVRSNGGSDDDVRLVTKLFSDMEAIQARSFCDFYSVADGLLKNHDCQGEYLGPVIDSKIEKIDKDWYVNPESLSITILLSYRDN